MSPPSAVREAVGNPPAASFELAATSADDPWIARILDEDLPKHASPLEVLHDWARELANRASHGALGDKLDALFRHGLTPGGMSGFLHGITLSMRLGLDAAAGVRRWLRWPDPLQVGFGRLVSPVNPWAGKELTPASEARWQELTECGLPPGEAMVGTNRFRRVRGSLVSTVAARALPAMMPIEPQPEPTPAARSWVFARGGLFVARRARCVDEALADKEVLDLNYRFRRLGNRLPARLLRDQLVRIGRGLYLGKLYYATRRLWEEYDPERDDAAYRYRSFGYFLLLDGSWRAEKDRLFPELACE